MLSYSVASLNPFQRTSKRPYIQGRLGNLPFSALFDTGADVSCVSEQLFRQIPVSIRPQKIPMTNSGQFKSAGGQSLDVKGKYKLPLQLQGKQVQHDFYVIRNLNEPVILGIDFITQQKLQFCPQSRDFYWQGEAAWRKGTLKCAHSIKLAPLSCTPIQVNLLTDSLCRPTQETSCVATIAAPELPLLSGGPGLIKIDKQGSACISIQNCAPYEVEITRGTDLGTFENVENCDVQQLNPQYINSVADEVQKTKPNTPLTPEKKKFILDNVTLNVPDEERSDYLKILCENHQVFSDHKHDLGKATTLQHEITLKTNEPIYIKQFKIPEAHQKEVENHVKEWLKLGVIQPSRSKYNSPVFVVAKKDGGLRIVQDFRALNAQSHIDKYSMKDVQECVSDIGRSGSTIFSTIDLTSGFWQMLLEPASRPYTAFTVPGMGQFEWITSPMGLLGCPASFQRLVEAVVAGLINIIVYIDDLLVHSKTHKQHRDQLHQLFQRLQAHGLKINLKKCVFGSKDVLYLGFRLTQEGIKPGQCKLKAVGQTQPPVSVHEVRQFLGLCNFFRAHVKNFAQISAPLCKLTQKDCKWKSGPLPEEALKSFRTLQSILVSEPVMDYPRPDRQYALITDAALGDDLHPGGLGAILTQMDEKQQYKVIAYASRKLLKHEKNYTPFLLEMQAAIWAMDHFYTYLRGRHFTLITDHKPLEQLGKVHTRTLNRLQEVMNTFDFDILYKKGSEMPADFLSRNVVDSISWEDGTLLQHQNQDGLILALKEFLLNRKMPNNQQQQQIIKSVIYDCFIENDLVWKRIKRSGETARVVIFLPQTLISQVLEDAHGSQLGGHDGVFKTKERILQCYYWPGMDADITKHIQACHKCQVRKTNTHPKEALLVTPAQCTEPNQRVHADLFGPLKASGGGKKYILCITDAFTKYVELVALPNKEAVTVATAFFNRWICRYGSPLQLTTDQGSEFMAKVSLELYNLLHINHVPTTSYHPQCNAQVEVVNKTIAKYLATHVEKSTLDWELYLPPLMFTYNTSYHKSIQNTPFMLTFGVEPRIPGFPAPELRRKFYGESEMSELHMRLQYAREIARLHNEQASDSYKHYHDAKSAPHKFQVGQLVLLKETQFQNQNRKLAMNYSGPHRILKLVHENNAELLQTNGKKLLVHVNRLKPYIVPPDKINFEFPPIDWELPVKPMQKEKEKKLLQQQEKDDVENYPSYQHPESYQHQFHAFDDENREIPEVIQTHDTQPTVSAPRPRGRPRKNALAPQIRAPPIQRQPSIAPQSKVKFSRADRPVPQRGEGGMMTRSRAAAAHFDPSDNIETNQAGPFVPVQDEFAAEVVELIQRTIVDGIKRARKRKTDRWSSKQKSLFRTTGDTFDFHKYESHTHQDYIPAPAVTPRGPSPVGTDSQPEDSDTDESEAESGSSGRSTDSQPSTVVLGRGPPSRENSPPPSDPGPHFSPVPTSQAKTKPVTSPAVRAFQGYLRLGTSEAKTDPKKSAATCDKFLDLSDPKAFQKPLPQAIKEKSDDVFQDLEDFSRRQSGLPRTPPTRSQFPQPAQPAKPAKYSTPPPSPPPRPKSAPSGAIQADPFNIPTDPFAKSTRLTRSPTRAQATANPFAQSSRLTRSPPPSASTRSKSAAPATTAPPKVPIERKKAIKKQ